MIGSRMMAFIAVENFFIFTYQFCLMQIRPMIYWIILIISFLLIVWFIFIILLIIWIIISLRLLVTFVIALIHLTLMLKIVIIMIFSAILKFSAKIITLSNRLAPEIMLLSILIVILISSSLLPMIRRAKAHIFFGGHFINRWLLQI